VFTSKIPSNGSVDIGNRFVERLGGHVECMRGFVQIVVNNCAGFKGHSGSLSYSLFVLLYRHY
jgi:hypothetical protein